MTFFVDAPAPSAPRLAPVEGDPEALRSAARGLDTVHDGLSTSVRAMRARASALGGDWVGVAGDAAPVAVEGVALLVESAQNAMSVGAAALRTYADALETARATVTSAQGFADDAATSCASSLRMIDADTSPDMAFYTGQQRQAAIWEAQAAFQAQAAAADRARDTLETAALTCRRTLEDTRSVLVRGHRESFEDYVNGIIANGLGRLPGLSGHEGTLGAATWAATSGVGMGYAGWYAGKYGGKLWQYWTWNNALGPRPPLTQNSVMSPVVNQLAARLNQLGIQRGWATAFGDDLFAGANRLGRVLFGTSGVTGSVNGITPWAAGRAAAAAADTGALRAGLSAGAKATGVVRGLGVIGAVGATGMSFVNVASQGNPIEAFQENGIDYVADVAELGFNASLTAAMIAPNPVTIGAAVITGAIYGTTEIIAHWDEIEDLAANGAEMVADGWNATTEVVGDAVDAGVEKAKEFGSWLNPFD
ncbi:WXG100 family type VII secretion target [Oerskovia turbata]